MAPVGAARLRVEVLGPLRVRDADGTDRTPPGELQRRLLALLTLRRGETVTADRLVDVLWPTDPPGDPTAALHTHVFRLRRSLPDGAVASSTAGYRLDPDAVEVDADALADAVATSLSVGGIDPAAAAAALDAALATWRGGAYAELIETDEGRAEASRLDELRVRALEERLAARLAAGDPATAVAEAASLVAEQPLRERPRSLLMSALAGCGRVAEAIRAYDDFRRLLGEELGIEPSPVLADQQFALLAGLSPTPVPATAAARSTTSPSLPVPSTSLVGRDELVAHAVALVADHRLVTLLGTGGVGKTRLLLEVGHRVQAERPSCPVVLCELASASADTTLDVVATALGVELRSGAPPSERIVDSLRSTEAVLLFDNCEHVLDPVAELVEHLLTRAPAVRVVTTTRERLRVAGEHVCPVPPLPLPDGGDNAPAVRLFVERARAVRSDFWPTDAELATVEEIVRRLDGLPLAIELAAARVQTMDVDEVAAGLDRRFRLLTSGARTSTRHRSLGAAVAWSYSLLPPDLQQLLSDVSVFPRPFVAAGAAAVHGAPEVDVVHGLAELAERSLIIRAGPAYALLETIREFGIEQLAATTRGHDVGRRHAAYVVALAEDANRRLGAPNSETVLSELDSALPDLRAAMAWLLEEKDVDGAARLAVALQDYGFHRLRPEVLTWAEKVCALDPDGTHPMAPSLWATSALAAWQAGDIAEAGRRSRQAGSVVKRGVETPEASMAQANQALYEGRLDDAVALYDRTLAADTSNTLLTPVVAGTRVLALAYAGDPSARAAALDLLASVEGHRSAAAAFAWYAAGEAELFGDVDAARARYARALEIAEATGAVFTSGLAEASAASIEARVGDATRAAERFRHVLQTWRRAGMWATQWTILRSIAGLLARLDRPRDAAVVLGAVLGTDAGHRLYGADAALLDALDAALRVRLGDAETDAARAEGARLDSNGAVDHALRSLAP